MKIELEQNTKEWQEYRKNKFNASEVGDLFNVGFNSREQLAHIKYGNLDVYKNKAMQRGHDRESEIRAYAEFVSGERFEPSVYVWDKDERFSASLDGINEKGDVICELKSSLNEFETLRKTNEPSRKYFLQVQQQLLVSGAKNCFFVVENPETFECEFKIITPDKRIQKEIVKEWDKFESEFKDKVLPELEAVIDENNDTKNYALLTSTLKHLSDEKKLIEEQEKEIKEKLIALANGVRTRAYGVLIYPIQRKSFDYKKFIADKGLVIDENYSKITNSWAVKV